MLFVDGHTEKQMIPKFKYKNKDIVYVADLIPTVGHIPLPYLMGYDVRPLVTMQEKSLFLESALKNSWYLFMEHDPYNEVVCLKKQKKVYALTNLLNYLNFNMALRLFSIICYKLCAFTKLLATTRRLSNGH